MSIASKNLFDILGDDGEQGAPQVASAVDKKVTSSKKSDVPPPKANAARANPKKQGPGGNEAAFRDKSVGHSANKTTPAPENTGRKTQKSSKRQFDRHSATGKTDTKKKLTKGWGDDNKEYEEEQAGEQIAKTDGASDDEAAPAQQEENTQTLEEYLASLSVKNEGLDAPKVSRKANDGQEWKSGAEVKNEEQDFFAAQKTKTLRQKQKKEKTVIEPELTFAAPRDSSSRREGPPRGRGSQRGPRGGNQRGAGRGGQRGGRQVSQKTVNINNTEEFPTLGA